MFPMGLMRCWLQDIYQNGFQGSNKMPKYTDKEEHLEKLKTTEEITYRDLLLLLILEELKKLNGKSKSNT